MATPAPLSTEVQDLFQYVQRYTPVEFHLEFKLQPWVPDYIPSLGSVDDQIKVPRPDGQPDFLGLTCTDEPALQQSDPALLALTLRHKLRKDGGLGSGSGSSTLEDQPLGWVEDPAQQPHKLDSWVDAVSVLHQGEASASTVCAEPEELEALMQPWPADMAEHVRASSLPDPKQDVDLKSFARLACRVVDIPMGASSVEALHTLFGLFLLFKASPEHQQRHFDAVEHELE